MQASDLGLAFHRDRGSPNREGPPLARLGASPACRAPGAPPPPSSLPLPGSARALGPHTHSGLPQSTAVTPELDPPFLCCLHQSHSRPPPQKLSVAPHCLNRKPKLLGWQPRSLGSGPEDPFRRVSCRVHAGHLCPEHTHPRAWTHTDPSPDTLTPLHFPPRQLPQASRPSPNTPLLSRPANVQPALVCVCPPSSPETESRLQPSTALDAVHCSAASWWAEPVSGAPGSWPQGCCRCPPTLPHNMGIPELRNHQTDPPWVSEPIVHVH